ncbi:hypothetical protein HALA3H3_790010 [Halomonas sp. A3H3]|nr:hypothetical protein HALA3H3_790010 [Halomonas sp. A3H3]
MALDLMNQLPATQATRWRCPANTAGVGIAQGLGGVARHLLGYLFGTDFNDSMQAVEG